MQQSPGSVPVTYKAMITAGRLAMFSAFASLPVAFFSWKLGGRVDATATIIQTIIQIVAVLIFLAINLNLKRLLNAHFSFHDTDRSIEWMIKANVVAGILTVTGLHATELRETLGLAALLIMAAQGLVQLQFGYRLLRLENNLGGLHKPFCYANMATGICVASFVLILVGILISALADLMLGTIFFSMAKLAKNQQQAELAEQ